ncbi:cupredoxin domain-containing protein [Methanolobus sp. ZRKC2]|uniref:cupredoxin domain-containing protein n=1 Tax=Methanolobus sp. ZRKC2 TaxID=3125783 RepID=UPI0032548C27
MSAKIFVIFLLLCSLVVAGCVAEEEPGVDENTSEENQTEMPDEENVSSDMDNETPPTDVETPVDEEETPAEDEDEDETDNGVTVVESTEPRTFTVTLKNFLAQPSSLTIDEGDSIFWINMNQPTRIFVLVSDDGLWENESLTYRDTFTYTFDEPGEFNYHVLGFEERMKGTITVK